MTDQTSTVDDEPVGDDDVGAPGPEQPTDIELFAEDAGTVIGPLHVRDADVDVPEDARIEPDPASDRHPDADKTREEKAAFDPSADYPAPIDGELVEYLQGVSGTRALALMLNGTVFLFDVETVGALKQVVDQAVVGLSL